MRTITKSREFTASGLYSGTQFHTNIGNVYGSDLDSTTYGYIYYYTGNTVLASARALNFTFDFSDVSDDVEVTGVDAKAKIQVCTSTNGIYSAWTEAYVSLINRSFVNLGQKSLNTNTTAATIYDVASLTGLSETKSMLSNLLLRVHGQPQAGWSGQPQIRIYGAVLTVDYNAYVYDITASSSVGGETILTPSSDEIEKGGSVTYTLTTDKSLDNLVILDNGVDITSGFTGSDGVYTYTVSNVSEDHNVVARSKSGIFIKMGGEWRQVKSVRKRSGDGYVTYASPAAFIQEYTYTDKVFFQDFLPYIEPLTFEITYGGTINWGINYYSTEGDSPAGHTIYYSKNGGQWTPLTSTVQGASISVAAGDNIRFKGDNPTYYCGDNYYSSSCFQGSTAGFKVKGNIMSLIDSTNFVTAKTLDTGYTKTFSEFFKGCTGLTDASQLVLPATTLTEYCYYSMFSGCTNLPAAPALPATTLAGHCYENMFLYCESLAEAPELPATTLAEYCYHSMFGVTGLVQAPELPATTLESRCYDSMFNACGDLVQAPELPATTLATGCYENMFGGCESLTTAPDLPAATLADRCYYWMFQGCTNLNYIKCLATDITASDCTHEWVSGVSSAGTFIANGFSTGWEHTIDGIPEGWATRFDHCTGVTAAFTVFCLTNGVINISKKTASVSDASFGVDYNFRNVWDWNDHIEVTTIGGTSINVTAGTAIQFSCNMDGNVALSKGTNDYLSFQRSTARFNVGGNIMSLIANHDGDSYGVYSTATTVNTQHALTGLLSLGTPVVSADGLLLPATGVSANAYRNMFFQNTTLTSATFDIPAVSMGNEACRGMFTACANLKYSPTSIGTPETAMPASGCMFTFSGCTILVSAPELPAHSVGDNGYTDMFKRCTSLTIAPELPATAVGVYSYQAMFSRCPLVKAPSVLPAMTLKKGCYSWMFEYITTLEVAPHLPALTLVDTCYDHMFTGCTALKYVSAMFTTTPGTAYTSAWLSGVSSTGTFVKNSSATWTTTGAHGVPNGWAIQRLSGGTGPILWLEHRLPSSYDDDGGYESFMRGRVETPYRYGVFPFIKEGTMELDGETYYLYKNCITEDNEGYAMYALSDTEYTDVTGLNRLSCLKDINNRFKPFRYILGNDKSVQYVPGNEDVDHYFLVRT